MAYVSISDVSELGHKFDDTQNDDIISMCNTASHLVDGYIQRVLPGLFSLEDHNHSEMMTVRIKGGMIKFFPTYYHITSVDSMKLTIDPFNDLEVTCENAKVFNYQQYISARVRGVADGEYYATTEYRAGYPNDINGKSTIPVDIRKAALLILQTLLSENSMERNFNVSGLTMFKQGSLQAQRSPSLLKGDIPSRAQILLASYRRTR